MAEKKSLKIEQIKDVFGINPESIGVNPRCWWRCETKYKGYLCVYTKDGGSNEIDKAALARYNFVKVEDGEFDSNFLSYYFLPLKKREE